MIQIANETVTLPAALPLRMGGLMFNTQVAYQGYGAPTAHGTVVLLHDLDRSHRALDLREPSAYQPSGWGRDLFRDPGPLHPPGTPIVSLNLLGSPFGSTSAATVDPQAEVPLGAGFPDLAVDDIARTVSGLLRALGIERARALVGFGFGGMVALRVGALFPELADSLVTVGAAHAMSDEARATLAETTDALMARGGGVDAMKEVRRAHLAVLRPQMDTSAEVEAFAELFDPIAYARLCCCVADADLGGCLRGLRARTLIVGASESAFAPAEHVRRTAEEIRNGGSAEVEVVELPVLGDATALLAHGPPLRDAMESFLR